MVDAHWLGNIMHLIDLHFEDTFTPPLLFVSNRFITKRLIMEIGTRYPNCCNLQSENEEQLILPNTLIQYRPKRN